MDRVYRVLLPAIAGAACALAACSGDAGGGLAVQAGRARCGDGWRPASAGTRTLLVHNGDSASVDVTVVDPSSGTVFAELEGVGPGTTRPLRVGLGAGTYAIGCRPAGGAAVTGPRVRVSGPGGGARGVRPLTANDLDPAVRAYRGRVVAGLGALVRRTDALRDAVRSGDLDAARGAWLPAHLAYARLGAAYGAFGDRGDAIDGRPAGLPDGVRDPGFRGFHRVERGLWHGASAASLRGPADRLAADVRALRDGFPRAELDPGDLGLRAHEILEDALRFELTGATDQGSGTTLATVAANVDGTRTALAPLRPLLADRLPELPEIDAGLDRASRLLRAQHRHGRWTPLDRLGAVERERINGAIGELVERLASVATVAAVRRTP
ncbi:EfeM/EfeO family lipoprotein [Actinomadura decatromicini]|uniref:EfeM/EfeO family lipoprotein n=1 Tax=Actinomadura decatromicini TaxID=2604572 RepID=A0A5D3F6X2_9ACTN|nr:EfeM/EfeO family lipoprotein [Actinomadura decatromicini]TYK43688.1 EfeM/EfeO family lipoprotein [Actinomadura decatromicini]